MALLRHFLKKSACLFLAFVMLTGCHPIGGEALFSYVEHPSSFTAVFLSQYGDVTCRVLTSDGKAELTLLTPERSAGITVVCTDAGCTVFQPHDGTAIPLSPRASSALLAVFDLLFAGNVQGITPVRSENGEETVIEYPAGTLVLNEQLLPCRIECPAVNGEMRTVRIENYTVLTPENQAVCSEQEGTA